MKFWKISILNTFESRDFIVQESTETDSELKSDAEESKLERKEDNLVYYLYACIKKHWANIIIKLYVQKSSLVSVKSSVVKQNTNILRVMKHFAAVFQCFLSQ